MSKIFDLLEPEVPVRLGTMLRWLSTGRPHGGAGERMIRSELVYLFGKHNEHFIDQAGNLHVDQRRLGAEKTLFSSHIDTAATEPHWGIKPRYNYKTSSLTPGKGAPILGADDTVGVWVMANQIALGLGGYHIFHVGEERGGIGSAWIAQYMPELLEQFDHAIAYDRRATSSIITHQGWSRCCSDTFGDALAESLMAANDDLIMSRDDGGLFTDTANYTEYIAECTNISAGYDHEHTERESLYLPHVISLMHAVTRLDWTALPADRDPAAVDPEDTWKTRMAPAPWWHDPREPVMDAGFCSVCGVDWLDEDEWARCDLTLKAHMTKADIVSMEECPDPWCESNTDRPADCVPLPSDDEDDYYEGRL